MAGTKPPIPVGYIKVAQHGGLGPAGWVNVFYLAVTPGSHTPGEVIAAAADAIHDFYTDAMSLAAFPGEWSTTWCTVTYRDAEDSTVRIRVADAESGTASGDTQDAQVSYLVNWSTGDPRRGGKPRTYVCGVPDSVMADSAFINPSTVHDINTTLLPWLVGLPSRTIPLELVEMSFRNDNTFRDVAAHYPILGATLNPVVATQRRRVDRLRPS